MLGPSVHVDTFARDHLPPADQWPEFRLGGFDYPEYLNAAVELTDRLVERGFGDNTALIGNGRRRTYKELADWTNRIAHALVEDYGVKPGNRVLVRSANNPAMVACWLAATKAGAVVVNTMPMLRAGELAKIVDKAEVSLALCDTRLMDETRHLREIQRVPEEGRRLRRHRQPRRRARSHRPQQVGPFRRREDRAGRRRAAGLHLRQHGRAEGDHAFPSRSPDHRRRLCEGGPEGDSGRRVRGVAAARLHLRSRRLGDLPAALRRGGDTAGECLAAQHDRHHPDLQGDCRASLRRRPTGSCWPRWTRAPI